MKNLIIISVVVIVVWQGVKYNDQILGKKEPWATSNAETDSGASNFNLKCDGRMHCSQMTSYEEAVFFLRNCPGVKMDGDGDGIPCERQFGR